MGTQAFLWPYRDGEPSAFRVADVLEAFGDAVAGWDPAAGRLRLKLGGPAEDCDVVCPPAGEGLVRSLLIERPLSNPGLWRGVLRLMNRGPAVLFFSDDPTPLFSNLRFVSHFPADLLAELGEPVVVAAPADVVGRFGGRPDAGPSHEHAEG